MLTQYQENHHISIYKLVIFAVVLFISACLSGFIVYFINSMVYLPLISPFLLSSGLLVPLQKWIKLTKFHSPKLVIILCSIAGVILIFILNAIPYWQEKNDFINDAQKSYDLTPDQAEAAFHYALIQETGSDDFWGYLKFQINEGSTFSNFFIINQTPIKLADFSMKGVGLLIYLLLDALFLTVPFIWGSYKTASVPFSINSNQWFDSHPRQIADILIPSYAELTESFASNQMTDIHPHLHEESSLPHPKLELYEIHNIYNNKQVLLTIIETWINEKKVINRKIISKWEVDHKNYQEIYRHLYKAD